MEALLTSFRNDIANNGVCKRDIEMLELELGNNVISSVVNLNKFTNVKTSVGLEECNRAIDIFLNTNKKEDPYLSYESIKQSVYHIQHMCREMQLLCEKVFTQIPEQAIKFFTSEVHTGFYGPVYAEEDRPPIHNILELMFTDAYNHGHFALMLNSFKPDLRPGYLEGRIRNDDLGISTLFTLDIFEAIGTHEKRDSLTLDQIALICIEKIQAAKLYTFGDIFFIPSNAPAYNAGACKLMDLVKDVKFNEEIILSAVTTIKNSLTTSDIGKLNPFFSILAGREI